MVARVTSVSALGNVCRISSECQERTLTPRYAYPPAPTADAPSRIRTYQIHSPACPRRRPCMKPASSRPCFDVTVSFTPQGAYSEKSADRLADKPAAPEFASLPDLKGPQSVAVSPSPQQRDQTQMKPLLAGAS